MSRTKGLCWEDRPHVWEQVTCECPDCPKRRHILCEYCGEEQEPQKTWCMICDKEYKNIRTHVQRVHTP